MRHIAIIGAGDLGGAVAHALARGDLARAITIVDDRGRIAAGKALDISQAAPVEGFAAQLDGATDVSAASGADVVVVADRAGAGDWQGEDALQLVRRIAQMARAAIVVCAGAPHREVVERAVVELKLDRRRVIGSAPEALAGAARALVALALDGSPRDVALTILGAPPHHVVLPWEEATYSGRSITGVLDEPARRRIDATIPALWPPGPQALAAACAKVIAAIDGRVRQTATCFVAVDGTSGTRWRTVALPVRLGSAGIVDVVLPALSVGERVALDNAMVL